MTKGRRRGHGEGAVYQRASDGRWVGVLDLGTVGGQRCRKYVYGTTQREALAKLALLRREVTSGHDVKKQPKTVAHWLEDWLRIKKADGLRSSTLRRYDQLIETHINPELGKVRLDKLTPADVRALISGKSESHLSQATVAHILRLMRNALGEAERLELVNRNVAKAVRMPKVTTRQVDVLDIEAARRLMSVTRTHRLYALFSTALVLGLRRGEVLGLAWADLDFKDNTIRVRQSLQRIDGELVLVPPKTKASTSVIAAPPSLMKMLSRHRAQQRTERLALGSRWPGLDLVFTSTVGTPVEPRNLSREWARLRDQADLPSLRFHDLRHSCATIMLALGIHPRVVMEMLRHSQIDITMNTYSHVSSVLQREAADALESALFC